MYTCDQYSCSLMLGTDAVLNPVWACHADFALPSFQALTRPKSVSCIVVAQTQPYLAFGHGFVALCVQLGQIDKGSVIRSRLLHTLSCKAAIRVAI